MQQNKQGDYPVSQSDADEFRRLSLQDGLLNSLLPLLPPNGIAASPKRVLDVACGTGGWLREIKRLHPQTECIGLDKNGILLEHAQNMAESAHLSVDYIQGDMFHLLNIFSEKRFDLIHLRCASWFLGTRMREVFAACQHLLAPGGTFCVTDFEQPFATNNASCKRYNNLFFAALQQRGTVYGGTSDFPVLFTALGFEQMRLFAHVLNLSAGSETRQGFMSDVRTVFSVFKPMVLGSGLISEDEYDTLHQQCLAALDADDFGMLGYILTITGQKA